MKKLKTITILFYLFVASCSIIPEPTPTMIINKDYFHKEKYYHDNLKPINKETVNVLTFDKINEVAKMQLALYEHNPELQLMGTITNSSSRPFKVNYDYIKAFAADNGFEIATVLEVQNVKGYEMIAKPLEKGGYKYLFKIREGEGYQFCRVFFFSSQKPNATIIEEGAE